MNESITVFGLICVSVGLFFYVLNLRKKIKMFELRQKFSVSEVSGAKKRITNFLQKNAGIKFTDVNLHKELNKKKHLDWDLFEVALNESTLNFMVVK